ncbi:MAG: hypothetical protein GY730_07225, partial [bacterium]|nr:hypothetical protein [bacterium]
DNEIHFEMTCKMHFNESSLTTFDTERKKQIMNKYAYLITLFSDLSRYAKKLDDKYKNCFRKITTCKTKLSIRLCLTAITAFTFFAKVIDSDRNDKDHVISDTSQICRKNREIFKSFLFRDLMKEIVGFNIFPFRYRDHKLFFEFTSRLVENGQYITMLNNNLKEHYNHKIPGLPGDYKFIRIGINCLKPMYIHLIYIENKNTTDINFSGNSILASTKNQVYDNRMKYEVKHESIYFDIADMVRIINNCRQNLPIFQDTMYLKFIEDTKQEAEQRIQEMIRQLGVDTTL